MRACIHRGSLEIGGSCVELEQDGKRIVLDLGLPLDAQENTLPYLPSIKGLDGQDPTLLGVLITHSHLDHTGLLKHISPNVPVGMGPAARRIMEMAAPFLPEKFPIPQKGWDYQAWKSFNIGPFHITPFLVDHSAYDSYALLIEAGGKRVFYSGDFRAHGRKSVLFDKMLKHPPKNVDILLMEGSTLGRIDSEQSFPSETDIEKHLAKEFADTPGLALVHASAQNIDRVVSVMRAAKQTGRKLIIDLYTAVVLEATDNINIPQSHWQDIALFVPQPQRAKIFNNAWFDQLNKHSANRIFMDTIQQSPHKYTLLFRPLLMNDLSEGECMNEAVYIYSQWDGYWERGDYDHVKKWLMKNNLTIKKIHTSGHASPVDLKKFVETINPARLVPIHSFWPQKYFDLFSNVELHTDGEYWDI